MGLFDSIGGFVSDKVSDVGGAVVKAVPLPSSVKRFGKKVANSKALRFGEKVAGGAVRLGQKMKSVGDKVHSVSGKAASVLGGVPVVGTAAALVDKAAMGTSALGGALSSAGGAAQGVIRVGRSMGEMKTGGDLISTMRDVSRASDKMGGSGRNLVSQARSLGSGLQRRK